MKILCWLFGHKKFLNGRYKRWSDAWIEYWHCERCNRYWKRVQKINKWYEPKNPSFELPEAR